MRSYTLPHLANASARRQFGEPGQWLQVVGGAVPGIEIELDMERASERLQAHNGEILPGPFNGFTVYFPDSTSLLAGSELLLVVWELRERPPLGVRTGELGWPTVWTVTRGTKLANGLSTTKLFDLPALVADSIAVPQIVAGLTLGGYVSTNTGTTWSAYIREAGPAGTHYPLHVLRQVDDTDKKSASLYGYPYPLLGGDVRVLVPGGVGLTVTWAAYKISRPPTSSP